VVSPLRVPLDLAERWNEEQLKLFKDITVQHFMHNAERAAAASQGNVCFLDSKLGLLSQNTMAEI